MWTPLQDQRQIEFYQHAQLRAGEETEDWNPMIRVIRQLQEQRYANQLFAFTSVMHFHVTTASDYVAFSQTTETVGITWLWPTREFHLRQHTGSWITAEPPQHVCSEANVLAAVEPMVAALLESSCRRGHSDA